MDTITTLVNAIDSLKTAVESTRSGFWERLGSVQTIIGAIAGFIGSFGAQYFLQWRHARNEITKELFAIRIKVYQEVSMQLQKMLSVKIDEKDGRQFPMAYEDLKEFNEWLLEAVNLWDKHQIFLNKESTTAFENFNRMILSHRAQAWNEPDVVQSIRLRNIGKEKIGEINSSVKVVLAKIKDYLNKTYKANLE